MLNRREVCSFLSGIPLVGWMFSVGEGSTTNVGSLVSDAGGIQSQSPSIDIPNIDGSRTCIPLGLNFKIVEYTPDNVNETMYRNGKLTQSDSPIWSYYDKKIQFNASQKFQTRPSTKAERDEEIEELEERLIREEDRNSELWSEIQKLKMEIWELKRETL